MRLPRLPLMPAGVGIPAQYPPSGVIITKELDLGAVPTRPVLLFPFLADTSPATGSAIVTRYQTRANQVDPWGPWAVTVASSGGGALTVGTPQRYLLAEITLITTDTTQTPVLIRFGVYD